LLLVSVVVVVVTDDVFVTDVVVVTDVVDIICDVGIHDDIVLNPFVVDGVLLVNVFRDAQVPTTVTVASLFGQGTSCLSLVPNFVRFKIGI